MISAVFSNKVNIAKIEASGIDMDVGYTFDFDQVLPALAGQLSSHAIVEYFDKYVQQTATVQNLVGLTGNVPRWKATLSETYILDDFSANVRALYRGRASVEPDDE